MEKVRKMAIQECRLIVQKGRKIALLRDLAIEFGCDVEVVADLQGHYEVKKEKLDYIKLEHGL